MFHQVEIHRMAQSGDREERTAAADQLGWIFKDIPDREQAWEDLHGLTQDPDIEVRLKAAKALGYAFPHVPDKEQAWKDMILLIQDENALVKNAAVESLGICFPHVPDKERAWKNLHWLVRDARRSAAIALGAAYPYILDKEKALQDLNRLALDREKGVRISANYSLGRISIFNASGAQNEEIFRNEIEKALVFFEESAKYATFFTPARFSLSFYRSFHAIVFREQDVETEIRKYLADIRIGVSDLENREELLARAGELANALKVLRDHKDIKSRFETYRQYCESAADIIDTARHIRRGYKYELY